MSLRQLEIVLLGMLAFVLPNLETPKTLFWALYVLVFLIRKQKEGELWRMPETPVAWTLWGMIAVSVVSTAVNWPMDNGVKGIADTLRHVSLFLCIHAGGYTTREMRNIALAVIAGALAGLGFGLLEVMNNINTRLQFHSAGVVTQSAIYLGMVIILILGFILQCRDLTKSMRGALVVVLLLTGVALVYMGSRGSLLAVSVTIALLVLLNFSWRTVFVSIGGIAVIAVASYFVIKAAPQNVLNEGHYERLSVERFKKSDSERVQAWKIAIAQLKQGHTAIIGIGPKNFRSIDPADLGIESSFYERTGVIHHAHNLFLTALVETGVIGLGVMLVFYYLIVMRLFRVWKQRPDTGPGWTWYAGLGGVTIPIIAGSFNAPFSQEHAMLAMILMAMMYSSTRRSTEKQD